MTISDYDSWRQVLRQQQLANARRWLDRLTDKHQRPSLLQSDYENLLRALETTLASPDTFQQAFDFIEAIFTEALGYADWDRWAAYLEQALSTAATCDHPAAYARLLEHLTSLTYYRGQHDTAHDLGKQVAEAYQKLGDQAGYGRALVQLALLIDLRGETRQAIDLITEAQHIAQATDDHKLMAATMLTLANIHRRQRHWPAALTAAQEAYRLYRQLNQPAFTTRAHLTMLHIWAELGNWQKVAEVGRELTAMLTATGNIVTLMQVKNNIGIAAFNQKKYRQAEQSWQEALNLLSQMQEPAEEANLYNNLGMVYIHLGELATAESMLNKAAHIYEALGDTYHWANALDNLADVHEHHDDLPTCRHTLQTAVAGLQPIATTRQAKTLLTAMQNRLAALPPATNAA